MARVDQIRRVLERRGLRGPLSIQQVAQALRPLAVRPRLVPRHVDDSQDPTPEILTLSPAERRALGIRGEPVRPSRVPSRPSIEALAAGAPELETLHMSATAAGPDIFTHLIDTVSDVRALSAYQPALRLRVRALACRNDDKKLSDGSAPQSAQEIGAAIKEAIEDANGVFESAGIELVFYPTADVEIRNETKLNQDFIINPSHPDLWRNPPLISDELDTLAKTYTTKAYRDSVGTSYAGRLVLLFAEGTQFVRPQDGWRWCSKCQGFHLVISAPGTCPAGGQHSMAGTGAYAIAMDATGAPGQQQWRWCSKCWGLLFTGHNQGVCPAGGTHDTSTSAHYVLQGKSLGLPGQAGWRWCKKCQGLYFSLNNAGVCPAGGGHDGSSSGDYSIPHGTAFPWFLNSPAGFAFSGYDNQFARMTARVYAPDPFYGAFLSHELGHYLNLAHTHDDTILLTPEQEADAALTNQQRLDILTNMVRERLDKARSAGTPVASVVDKEFDYDEAHGVDDTAPDIGPQLIEYLNQVQNGSDACGATGTVSVALATGESVTITPPRDIVMSYFKGCIKLGQHFSDQQIKRMRDALINDARRHIVAVQLGETATPSERACAVWNPSNQGQVYVSGYKEADFDKKVAEMQAAGMRLRAQQAYTAGGSTRYDGIWNPGTQEEHMVWRWTVADFKNKDIEMHDQSMRLVHLESYLLPDGQVRVNAIWNPGTHEQMWIQGWKVDDLETKLNELLAKNFRVAHLNSWNLPNGDVRYDVIMNAGSHAQYYILGWTAEDFGKKYGEMWGKNFRLLLLDAYSAGGDLRYSGVWNPSSSPQFVMWGKTREQIRACYDEMWNQGMRLASMNMARVK